MSKIVAIRIIRFLSCFGLLMFSLVATSQNLSIKNIKPQYTVNEKVYFQIVNNSETSIFYSVSLETLVNENKWYEIRSDVFNTTPTKKTRLFEIRGNNTTEHFFTPKELLNVLKNKHHYRLKISFGTERYEKQLVVYSDSFDFE